MEEKKVEEIRVFLLSTSLHLGFLLAGSYTVVSSCSGRGRSRMVERYEGNKSRRCIVIYFDLISNSGYIMKNNGDALVRKD